MDKNAPPSARIAPLQSLSRHRYVSMLVLVVVLILGIPFVWIKGESYYNAESVFMVAPNYMKNMETDKEVELQSNSQYLQFVFHLSKSVTRYDVLQRALLALKEKGIDLKPSGWSERKYIEYLQRTTYVRSIPETYMVRIGRDSDEKKHLEELVNAVTEAFIQTTRDEQIYGSSGRAGALLETQKNLQAEMKSLEDERADLAEKLNLTTFAENIRNPYDGMLEQLREKLNFAITERIQAEVALASFVSDSEVAATFPRSVLDLQLQDSGLQTLRNEVVKRSEELGRISAGLENEHPAKKMADSESEIITARLNTKEITFEKRVQANYLKRFKASVEQKRNVEVGLQNKLSELQAQAADFAKTFRHANWLTTELSKREAEYYEIRDRLNYLQSEKNAIGFVRLVTPALPPEIPLGAGKVKLLAIVVLLGIALAFVVPVVIEILDRSLRSVNEAEKVMGFASAGWQVRISDRASKIKSIDQSRRFASTLLRNKARKGRSIYGFTSIKLGVGVTQLTLETARTLMHIGSKVLVVEANNFKPFSGFEDGLPGLTDYLADKVSIGEIVKPYIHEGTALNVVAIGGSRTSGIKRLDKLKEALMQWRQEYDFILIDLSPLLLSADGELLIEVVGDVLLVTELRSISKAELSRAKGILEKIDPESVGLFVNNVPVAASNGAVDPILFESMTGKKYSQFMNVPYPLLKWEILLTRWQAWRMQRRLRQLRLKKGYNTSQ